MSEEELVAVMREIERTPFDELTDAQKRAWREAFEQWLAMQEKST